jgi:hypothetical protein
MDDAGNHAKRSGRAAAEDDRAAMSRKTLFFVQSFKAGARGRLAAEPAIACRSADNAVMRAEGYARTRVGVWAFSVEGDAEMDDFDPPKVLFQAGRVPEPD